MLHKYWLPLTIATILISLLSIKGFPIAFGALYLPILFKIIKLQLNLSNGLIENISAQPFIKSNQTGVFISVLCCILITGILMYSLNDFYAQLTGFIGFLIQLSPFTLIISVVLYILSALAVIKAVKVKYGYNKHE
ncbi:MULTISPECIES: hypothetical protein [unclassified Staphylococcus]|uniref:hypothetical protein n=1 Tax=unclassified Staphylococcus TaxID=91994 RepID=UPI00187F7917|nr:MULTISPECIES: hypothetical protein [unclassified Staphylococcus]MBF2757778.1 hypothetical protein [Staphylococcus haemolyticus]MBF2774508.1 hypothetical protein [Staphylococcus haemolyticus]MBF2776975.1 hypothetical protein [Staphylococcus haemolyticus]MBF2816443.1 hypothetical protein [Staphylococcus haemolyticus]MBF9721512.1 hypothetical protein [Staphylococcus haemolyticus]